ncbi:MAG: hypothetical protein SFU56_12585 [Capsulimonadales bacterium]|nr:hypothetical protein [Capsulimonadales bacterium]
MTAFVVSGFTMLGIVSVSPNALSAGLTPIEIDPAPSFTAGQPLPCAVSVNGSGNITITSVPYGAVSFSGSVPSGTSVVNATTSPNASGTITVILNTGGTTVQNITVAR